MKYSTTQYAISLSEALNKKSESERKNILKNFVVFLHKNKQLSRLPYIIKELERQHFKKLGVRQVVVESASEISQATRKEIKEIMGDKIFISEKVVPDILAGIRMIIDDETFIDGSARGQLEKLFIK